MIRSGIMTYEEFLDELRATPRDWRIMHGAIRRPHKGLGYSISANSECPISSLCGFGVNRYDHAATLKGIERHDKWRIVLAADGANLGNTKMDGKLWEQIQQIRCDLLAACGLVEDNSGPKALSEYDFNTLCGSLDEGAALGAADLEPPESEVEVLVGQ